MSGWAAVRRPEPGVGLPHECPAPERGLPIIAGIGTTVGTAHGDRGTRVRMTFAASP